MAIPPNITQATAVELGPLPASLTLNVNDSGTTYTVWYQYTAVDGDNEIGLHFFGDVTYIPKTAVYGPYPTTYLIAETATINRPFQIPVTPGIVYTFRVTSSTGNVGTAILNVEVEQFTEQDVPTGSFAINDDASGFPLDFLSGTTALPIRYIANIATGAQGCTLNNGYVCLYAQDIPDVTRVVFYNPQYTAIATVDVTQLYDFAAIGSNKVDTFYIGVTDDPDHDDFATIRSYSQGGVFGQLWILDDGGMRTLDGANDDTVAYYTQDAAGPIRRWDLINDLPLSNLAAAEGSGYACVDLLVLGDDSILALYDQTPGSHDAFIKRYDASGTLLNTYTLGVCWEPRIATALDDPDTFWLYRKPELAGVSTGECYFDNIQVSDGTVLTTVGPGYLFPSGVYRGTDALTPPARFGNATSCPFWIQRVDVVLEPPEPPAPPETRVYPLRRQRTFTIPNSENMWIFIQKLELELQRGEGLNTGQGNDPQVMFQFSRDGGKTWGPEHWVSAGKIGEYTRRVILRRLGRARNPVGRITVSDPVFWALQAAYMQARPGTS